MTLPYVKTTFVKPLCENNFGIRKGFTSSINTYKENQSSHGVYGKQSAAIKALGDNNKNHILKMDSTCSHLLAEIENVEKWKAIIEMENKQKNKKVDEFQQTIETQKKSLLDLQLLNENLNLQLTEEVQQRSFVSEKLHSTKEMCSALKKHFNTLQGHLEYRYRIEDMIKVADSKRLEEIEEMRNKLENINVEHSEKIEYLTNALASERNKVLDMRERFEQQLGESENEREALCTMVRNYEKEMENISALLDEEKNKSHSLERDKKDMESTIFQLENSKECYTTLLKEKEEALKLVEISKQDIEKKYLYSCSEMNDLQIKYKDLLESSELLKMESMENVTNLKQIVLQSNDKIIDMEKRLQEEINKNLEISEYIQNMEKEKCALENQVEEVKSELKVFENLKVSYTELEDSYGSLSKQNKDLNIALENINRDLRKCKDEKEQLSLLCEEKSEHLSTLKQEYENKLMIETDKLVSNESDYHQILNKLTAAEKILQQNAKVITDKEEEIGRLQLLISEKENSLEILQYENIEMKDKLETEKQSVKICLECEQFAGKIAEVDTLRAQLSKAEDDLATQNKSTWEVLKALEDTETKYNKDRLAKAEEILNYQEKLRRLDHEMKIAKYELVEFEQQKPRINSLNEEIEKFKKDILEHISKEKELENELGKNKEKLEFEAKKVKELENELKKEKKKRELEMKKLSKEKELKSELKNTNKKKKEIEIKKSDNPVVLCKATPIREEKITDSESASVKEKTLPLITKRKRNSKVISQESFSSQSLEQQPIELENQTKKSKENESNEVVMLNDSDPESIASDFIKAEDLQLTKKKTVDSRNKKWEMDSSGSECLELVYDKSSDNPVALVKATPKREERKTDRVITSSNESNRFITKRKSQVVSQEDVIRKKFGLPPRVIKDNYKGFILSSRQQFSTPNRNSNPSSSKENDDLRSPWKTPVPSTAGTPNRRKFFKTPLDGRECFKKPEKKLWF